MTAAPQQALQAVVSTQGAEHVQEWLAAHSTVVISEEINRLSAADMAVAYRLLPKDRALRVFELMDPPTQAELLQALLDEETTGLLDFLAPDDQAELLDEIPAKVAARLMEGLPEQQRAFVSDLLGYGWPSYGSDANHSRTQRHQGRCAGKDSAQCRDTADFRGIPAVYCHGLGHRRDPRGRRGPPSARNSFALRGGGRTHWHIDRAGHAPGNAPRAGHRGSGGGSTLDAGG